MAVETDPEIARAVDASGLACPLPVIELAKAMDTIDVGEVIELLATDAAAKVDVPVWCRMKRHRLLHLSENDGTWRFLVERAH